MQRAVSSRVLSLCVLLGLLLQGAASCRAAGGAEEEREEIELNGTRRAKGGGVWIAAGRGAVTDRVLARIVEHLRGRPVYVRVTGLAPLDRRSGREWDAVVLIHGYHGGGNGRGRPPDVVVRYLEAQSEPDPERILVIPVPAWMEGGPEGGSPETDAGIGSGADGITAASLNAELEALVEVNLRRLDARLGFED